MSDDDAYTLVIGDKNYSSWSLRPWLAMKHLGIPFTEEKVVLRRGEDTKRDILHHSPSGKVPCLKAGEILVWDTLAILEFLAERYDGFWPASEATRAEARAVSAEMHSSFQALRNDMPMDIVSRLPMPPLPEALSHNITRVVEIWRDARARHSADGPFLYGTFSIADAMYAPVVTRFETYGLDLAQFSDDGRAADYGRMIRKMPEMLEWERGAEEEMKARGLA